MKKFFTLFAVALLGITAYAQCPSRLYFEPAEAEQDASNAMFHLKLVNSADYLNGFNMEIQKPAAAEWLEDEEDGEWVGFTGYGHTILAMWEPTNLNWRETKLFQKADLKCSIKEEKLVIIEILSTLDCRFFPQLTEEDDNIVARFSLNFSGCEDGDFVLRSEATPQGCSFSYTGDPTGTYNGAITIDEPIVLELTKVGDIVKIKGTEPVVEPVTISGIVKDADGAPLKDVTVTLNEADAKEAITTTTNDEGAYSLQYTPEEGKTYNVSFEKEGYVSQNYDATEVPDVVTLEEDTTPPTGISTIGADSNNVRIYDIQGRELKSVPEHGIYIQNGKKYVK